MAKDKKDRKGANIVTPEQFADRIVKVIALADPELVLLKGHLLVEQALQHAAMIRLRARRENVPRFAFATLVDIVFVAEPAHRRARVVWFNNLRNALAHEYDALDDPAVARQINAYGLSWPKSTSDRAQVLKAIVEYTALVVYIAEQHSQLPPITASAVSDYRNLLEDAKVAEQEIAQFEAAFTANDIEWFRRYPESLKRPE
jgi:hypothetical protein